METDDIIENMKNINHQLVSDLKASDEKSVEEQPAGPEPADIYQRNQDRIYENSKKTYPKGSSANQRDKWQRNRRFSKGI